MKTGEGKGEEKEGEGKEKETSEVPFFLLHELSL
jgi:hypothetical protein